MPNNLSSNLSAALIDWLKIRLPFVSAATQSLKRRSVPRHRNYWCYYLGGLALVASLIQMGSGILLMFYYQPSMVLANQSVVLINRMVPMGLLIRNMHAWTANILITCLFLHALTAMLMRSYRKPRELTWVAGALTLFVVLGEAFSGSLLPCNALAVNAASVGVSIMHVTAAMLPGALAAWGQEVLRIALGSQGIGQEALSRFFALHVVVFPLLLVAAIGVHLLLVYVHGLAGANVDPEHDYLTGSIPKGVKEPLSGEGGACLPEAASKGESLFPTFVLKNCAAWTLFLSLLLVLIIVLPHDTLHPYTLLEPYNPLAPAPAGIKPEWFFYFIFYPMSVVPRGLVIVGSMIFFLSLIFTPWLMAGIPRLWGSNGDKSKFPFWATIVVAQILFILTVFGGLIEQHVGGTHLP